MNFTPSNKPELPGFQMTPMIDVVFLLLCFFVTTAVYSQWEYEVDIQLPTAQTGKMPERLPGEIIVNLDADGTMRVSGKVLAADQLLAKLRMLAANFPGDPVILRSDLRTPYEHVVAVIDLCRQADIDNISFATEMASSAAETAAAPSEPSPSTDRP